MCAIRLGRWSEVVLGALPWTSGGKRGAKGWAVFYAQYKTEVCMQCSSSRTSPSPAVATDEGSILSFLPSRSK